MRLKRGGAYAEVLPFIKRSGVYGAVSSLIKSGGGYLAAGGPDDPPSGGFSGGDEALGWTAASLGDGEEITITTDGTYSFGSGPSALLALGFGSGVLADTTEGAPVVAGTYGDFVVVEGSRSKVVTKDGTRTFYTRIRDASWDLGEWFSAGRAGWNPGVTFENGMKICQVGMMRLESSSSADCQFKSLRFEVDTIGDDEVLTNEFYARSFRTNTNAMAIYDAAGAATNANIRHPHTNYGWCCHDLMITSSAASVADGSVLSRLSKQDGLPPQETVTTGVRFADAASPSRANRFVRQDYFGSDTVAPVDLWRADTIWQVGSFAHVKIGNAPTPSEATLPPVPCGPVSWSQTSIVVKKWSPLLAAMGATAQYLWVYNDEGQFVSSVLLSGSYTPPAYNPVTDMIGLSRGTGSAGSGRIVFDSNLAAPTGEQVAMLSAWIKPTSLARRNGFIDGGATNTNWCVFEADGSIIARIGGAIRILRTTGEHVLVSGQRHLIAARWSASLFEVLVDGNVVGSYVGSLAGFLPGRVMEGNNVGFNGVCYNITYSIDGSVTNRLPLNEGTGTAAGTPVVADIGAINGTITSGFTWVAE